MNRRTFLNTGLRGRTVFPSKVIGSDPGEDLARLFLEEAAKRRMSLFFGNYRHSVASCSLLG